ncbi:hypothetical protein LINGRAHAP2_LOCUS30730 [Linum grandiflorum]
MLVHILTLLSNKILSLFPYTCSIVISFQEHRIEGYTEPGETEEVKELLLLGSIYRIQNLFLIPARRILRSCPGDFALQIRPANLRDKIDEDLARPFFPLESFNIATMPVMRAIAQPCTSSLG